MQEEEILDNPHKPPQERPGKAYRIIRWVEMPILVIFMAGLSFRLMSWPGGSFMLLTGLSLLSLLYFISWIAPVIDQRSGSTIGFGVGVSFALATGIMGVLFHLMIWPGSQLQLMIGTALGGFFLLMAIAVQLLQSQIIHRQTINWAVWRLVPIIAWASFYLYSRGVPL